MGICPVLPDATNLFPSFQNAVLDALLCALVPGKHAAHACANDGYTSVLHSCTFCLVSSPSPTLVGERNQSKKGNGRSKAVCRVLGVSYMFPGCPGTSPSRHMRSGCPCHGMLSLCLHSYHNLAAWPMTNLVAQVPDARVPGRTAAADAAAAPAGMLPTLDAMLPTHYVWICFVTNNGTAPRRFCQRSDCKRQSLTLKVARARSGAASTWAAAPNVAPCSALNSVLLSATRPKLKWRAVCRTGPSPLCPGFSGRAAAAPVRPLRPAGCPRRCAPQQRWPR